MLTISRRINLPLDKIEMIAMKVRRINNEGEIIKAQRFRTQEKNRQDALERLRTIIESVLSEPKARKKTRPSRSSMLKHLDSKSRRCKTKMLRRRVSDD